MYFQSRQHQLIEVGDAIAAANFIRSSEMESFHAISWKDANRTFIAVPDAHIDTPFLEIALLEQKGEQYSQIESISNGWIKSAKKFAEVLKSSQDSGINMGVTQLIIGKPKSDEVANFTCGCCSTYFKSNVQYQMQFGQDQSYGICTNCEKYYL